MLELCHELRLPFVNWIAKSQVLISKINEIESLSYGISC